MFKLTFYFFIQNKELFWFAKLVKINLIQSTESFNSGQI